MQLIGAIIGTTGGISSGLGRDIWMLSFDQITHFFFLLYIYAMLYFVSIATLKLCFLFLYLRIFPKKSVRRLLWFTVGLTAVYGLAFCLIGAFQCRPIPYYWTRWDGEHEGTCINVTKTAWANGAISIALDFWIIAIPFAELRKLKLSLKKKLGVFAMFGVGLL